MAERATYWCTCPEPCVLDGQPHTYPAPFTHGELVEGQTIALVHDGGRDLFRVDRIQLPESPFQPSLTLTVTPMRPAGSGH